MIDYISLSSKSAVTDEQGLDQNIHKPRMEESVRF